MDVAALVKRAVKAARRLDRDPELEGVAHEGTLRAIRTYDPARCDNLEAWVVYVVKVDSVGYLRWRNSRREVALESIDDASKSAERMQRYLEEHLEPRFRSRYITPPAPPSRSDVDVLAAPQPQEPKLLVERGDWELLCEHYIERWNYTAIARKRNVTVGRAKELVRAATARFVRACEADTE